MYKFKRHAWSSNFICLFLQEATQHTQQNAQFFCSVYTQISLHYLQSHSQCVVQTRATN